ncbi:ricin-type beta-trefoil lectin domain protein [Streptomyces sp. NPDC004327]|uniref:ricin-type beta-trefoil lectin domain protein n=1 Tax=unclassified Streptomyces TaxID=2593676 RepID=UPI003682A8FA
MQTTQRRGLPALALAMVAFLLAFGAVLAPTPAQAAPPDGWNNRHLDEITLLGSHNGFANGADSVNIGRNQGFSLRDQLNNLNVRATELDIYGGNGVWVQHGGDWSGGKRLFLHMQTIVDFLRNNPHEVFVLTFEDYTDNGQLRSEFDMVPGLQDLAFNPNAWDVWNKGWPKVEDMVAANKRLLMFSGRYDKQDLNVFPMKEWTVQNTYKDGVGACNDRLGDGISTQLGKASWATGEGANSHANTNARAFQKLFFNNNFDARSYDDFYRSVKACEPKTLGRMPNMISTDWIGDGGNRDAERFVNDTNRAVDWNVASTNLCLDVEGGRIADGTRVQLYGCNWSNSQAWRRVPIDDSLDGFELRALGQCLDVAGGVAVERTRIQVYGCNGTVAQRWVHEGTGNRLRNLGTNMCLDVTDGIIASGTKLQLFTCNGSPSQYFDWRMV